MPHNRELSLPAECLIATGVLLFLLCLLERRRVGFWGWGFYSPRKRDWGMTVALGLFQAVLVGVLTSIVPVLNRAFDVHAHSTLGDVFLIAEAVAAGAAALAGLRAIGRRGAEEDIEGLLQSASRAATSALTERAVDSVPRALRLALNDPVQRAKVLGNLHQLKPESSSDVVVVNVSRWDSGEADEVEKPDREADEVAEIAHNEQVIRALREFIVERRLSPGRVIR